MTSITLTSLLVNLTLLIACNNATDNEEDKKTNIQEVSPDTIPSKPVITLDDKGCNTSNGEIWSVVRNKCIILTKTGLRMHPQEAAMDKTSPAWLLFSEDRIRVEIIFPTQKKPVIIRQTSAIGDSTKWTSGPLSLTEVNGIFALEDEGRLLYKSIQ